ncbi:hypothetical protein G7Y89_g11464 [Cudoniella acicularis]|uniref:Uncharacterized protein n=1 Tax=Cudoniella acicularis TaxID=354080 RepID=A0A8H4VY02_9HELO|nr:hypothetical protein G7Y89_g11464 [Cudoniella acicularis]
MAEKIEPTVLLKAEGGDFFGSELEVEHKLGAWNRFLSKIGWYREDMPAIEKSLVLRLDLMILVFGCLSFFTKYLDQAAITNAYVSGMKEDLHLYGNKLNYITIVFWSSYCTLIIPFCYYLTRVPINIALPTMEIPWGLFTFGCAWATNIQTIYAMRSFIGAAETCSFTAIICAETGPLQSPLPSLDLSSRCSNLSRALSPEHADKSAGACLGGSSSSSLENRLQFLFYLILLMPYLFLFKGGGVRGAIYKSLFLGK